MATPARVLGVLAVVAVVGLVVAAPEAPREAQEALFARGMKHFRQKSFRPAAAAFEELLERFPESERAREARYLLAESYRIARRFGRESTYPKAQTQYRKLIEASADDLWQARAQGGLARLFMAWNYWRHREEIGSLYEQATARFEKKVGAESPRPLRRELGQLYVEWLEAGTRMWGYTANWEQVAAQWRERVGEGGTLPDHQQRQVAWWKSIDSLVARLDALEAGDDLEARGRWAVGQRGAEPYLKQIMDDYAGTEWWDDAVFHLARQREREGKYLEAIALYEKLTQRFTEAQSRYVKQARRQVAEIRKPRINVRVPYAGLPGTKPLLAYSWRNQRKATFTIARCEPFGHPHHTSLIDMARAGRGETLKTWAVELENKGEHQHYSAQQELEVTEPGIYLVSAQGGGADDQALAVITRLAVVTKSSSHQTKVLVADALSGEPVSAADVQVSWRYYHNRRHHWEDARGASDDGGLYAHPNPRNQRRARPYVLARKGDSYAFAASHVGWWRPMRPGLWFYGYTDRPAYRPEEDVRFKFVVRNYQGESFRNVADQRFRVRIHEPRGGKIYEKVLATNANGTLADSLKLSAEPKLGHYRIEIRRADGKGNPGGARFRVEEYKLPEYQVEITTEKPTYRVGDRVRVKVAASYYFGGPVPEADCEVIVRQRRYWHFYRPHRKYSWYYDDIYRRRWGHHRRGGGSIVKRATLKTDAHGIATVEFDTPELPEHPRERRDYAYSIEARVVDKSRREITATEDIKVTVQPFYVYVQPKNHVYLPGDRVEVDVVARNANDAPVPTHGMFRVYKAVYNEEREKELEKRGEPYEPSAVYDLTELDARRLELDEQGKASYAFTPDEPAYLKLEMTALTETEEKVVGTGWAWVASEKEKYLGYRLSGVQVIPNKQTYRKGETAQVLVVSHFPDAYVWLGIEGDRLYDDQLLLLRERSKLVPIRIKDEYSPNVFVTANLVRDAMVWRHQREIVVPPEDRFIDVELATAKETYRPGEKAQFEVTATDHRGRPVECELSLGIVDTSVYYIQPEYAPDIRKFFYGRKRQLAVRTESSFSHLRHLRPGEEREVREEALGQVRKQVAGRGGGNRFLAARRATAAAPPGAPMEKAKAANGVMADREADKPGSGPDGGGQEPPRVRQDFRATAFWQPAVRTGPDGKAVVSVTFPDSLTDWTATARAVTPDTAVGRVQLNTKTKKNIIVRLQAPRFFQEKDTVTLSAVVHNYLEEAKSVRVSIEPSGVELVDEPVVTVEVPSGGEKRVDWTVRVTHPGEARVRVAAETDVESDAMGKTYEVLPHGVEKFVARTGSVGDPVVATAGGELGKSPDQKVEVVETLSLPAERNDLATVLNVDLSPSIAATMVDSLDYLAQYPYGCVEQTMSRFVPAVVTARTLRELGLENPELEAKLPRMVAKGLDRLYNFQRGDGGWGWWSGGDMDPWMTAYVVYGLTLAKAAGVEVDDGRLQRGIAALRKNLVRLEGRPDTLAYALSVLARHKIKEDKWLERIWSRREKLNAASRALLALAFHHLGDAERARVMLRNLEDYLEEDRENGTAHWGKTSGYWRWSHDAVEATSYALRAYLAVEPSNRLVKPIMKWLVNNRRGNRWKSTRDTAMAVYALTDYLRHSKELAPSYTATVYLNGRKVRELAVTKDNALSLDGRITLGDADLRSGENTVRIVKEGTGNLYYTAGMLFYTKEERIEGAGHEIFILRRYHKVELDDQNKEQRTPLDYGAALASGDRIEVTLEVEAKNDYEYLVFEDPKPSGCEPVTIRSGYRYGDGIGSYMEVRDEKTAFFVSRMSQGTHTITYTLRAEIPGTFNALPTSGYAMYIPDIRAISDEMRLRIGERAALPRRLRDAAVARAR
ncbi:MAG: MG2 domain-containing protein [Candidatus Brocadiia bacterium]